MGNTKKKKINSRRKGKAGELEIAHLCRLHWYANGCIRGQQRSGLEQADVVNALPDAHIECKRIKRVAALQFLEQAERDAKPGEMPIAVFRVDRSDAVVMFRLSDSVVFAERLAANMGKPIYPYSKDGRSEEDKGK